jgi:transcriptional regulator with GAF, ATPase, and Fis domain
MDSSRVGHDTISAPIRMAHGGGATSRPHVIALLERDTDRRHDLALGPRRWSLGKSPSCDITIDDPFVSSHHCVLQRWLDGTLMIRDCGSKNGTLVDGARVLEAEVRPGASITLGHSHLIALSDRAPTSALDQLRGHDPSFRSALDMAIRAARTECSVLIIGETGTGKDLVARAIHEASRRSGGPFVPINCGGFPRDLIGAELFGHARGAFTGATEARAGMFVQADGGTLFLDELGELSLELQPHLLRALETRRVRPVGAADERAVDVRFVAATNRLDGIGTRGSPIRFDLFHRVAAVTVSMPPLRDRRGDIPELARAFLDEEIDRNGPRILTAGAFDALLVHDWPGNVRELRQTILRAVSFSDYEIDVTHLGLTPRSSHARDPVTPDDAGRPDATSIPAAAVEGLSRHDLVIRELMANALARTGSLRAAARDLGMPKSTFADKALRYGLRVPRRKHDDDH